MKTIMQKEHPAMKPLLQQQRQIDQQLRQYVEGTYDRAKVQALATQKAQVEVQMTVAADRASQRALPVADRPTSDPAKGDGSEPRRPACRDTCRKPRPLLPRNSWNRANAELCDWDAEFMMPARGV